MIFEKAAKFEIVVCCRKIGGVLRVNYVYEWGGGGGDFSDKLADAISSWRPW